MKSRPTKLNFAVKPTVMCWTAVMNVPRTSRDPGCACSLKHFAQHVYLMWKDVMAVAAGVLNGVVEIYIFNLNWKVLSLILLHSGLLNFYCKNGPGEVLINSAEIFDDFFCTIRFPTSWNYPSECFLVLRCTAGLFTVKGNNLACIWVGHRMSRRLPTAGV